ncbi:MAG: sugar nucleotide-binding protein [Candidatus Omnitrophica bacterium]|nr:sugar nucleotide-binding protein [Candidatus Omnitrophota bacterium]
MKNKILILGKGFIGSRLQEGLDCAASTAMIRSFKDAEAVVRKYRPKTIINCIGYTGVRSVDDCELDKDKTLFTDAYVPLLLAEAALRKRIKLVHISSGCIYHYDYSGNKPVTEDMPPDFLDLFYSRAKIYSERALELLSRQFDILIIRTRVPLDNRPHPKNLLTKLIRYKKVIKLPNSVIYIPDLIKAVRHLFRIDATGLYNVVNKGGLYYPDLLSAYKKYVPDFVYEPIDYRKLNLVRTNLILSTKKLEDSGFKVRPVKEVLEECVKTYLKY